jgi:hypothetical protein
MRFYLRSLMRARLTDSGNGSSTNDAVATPPCGTYGVAGNDVCGDASATAPKPPK